VILAKISDYTKIHIKLECGPKPNVMAPLPNIGSAVCSTPQSLADAHYYTLPCSNAAKTQKPVEISWCPKLTNRSQPKFTILYEHVGEILLFNTFFRLSIHALVAKIYPDKFGAQMANYYGRPM